MTRTSDSDSAPIKAAYTRPTPRDTPTPTPTPTPTLSDRDKDKDKDTPREKRRGQNKNRSQENGSQETVNLCNFTANNNPCARANCKMSHDVAEYLAAKSADLDAQCPFPDVCPFGVRCRFLKSHPASSTLDHTPAPSTPALEPILSTLEHTPISGLVSSSTTESMSIAAQTLNLTHADQISTISSQLNTTLTELNKALQQRSIDPEYITLGTSATHDSHLNSLFTHQRTLKLSIPKLPSYTKNELAGLLMLAVRKNKLVTPLSDELDRIVQAEKQQKAKAEGEAQKQQKAKAEGEAQRLQKVNADVSFISNQLSPLVSVNDPPSFPMEIVMEITMDNTTDSPSVVPTSDEICIAETSKENTTPMASVPPTKTTVSMESSTLESPVDVAEINSPATSSTDIKNPTEHKKRPLEEAENSRAPSKTLKFEDTTATSLAEFTRRPINFKDMLYLAPLTTVGNLPFRRLCKTLGADITCSEMVLTDSLHKAVKSEWARLKRHSSESIYGVQICGSNVQHLSSTAEILAREFDIDFIDLNMGCPLDDICRKGMGAGMMDRTARVEDSFRRLQYVTKPYGVEVTAKMRIGIKDGKPIAHKLIPKIAPYISLATIHGRTKEQRYTKQADWNYIDQVALQNPTLPIFGNGDILSYEDYAARPTSTAGVMIGRGALIKPWIFTEIKEHRHWDISSSERFDLLRDFARFGIEHWGSDLRGINTTRRFLLEWMSFGHRYVPVGLLEHLPPRLNQRPQPYTGRNELETLFSSTSSEDWMTLIERVPEIGKAPEGFVFTPKHRANSYSTSVRT